VPARGVRACRRGGCGRAGAGVRACRRGGCGRAGVTGAPPGGPVFAVGLEVALIGAGWSGRGVAERGGELATGTDAEFLVDVAQVPVHGLGAEVEALGDLRCG
jgi:hypothetical protein